MSTDGGRCGIHCTPILSCAGIEKVFDPTGPRNSRRQHAGPPSVDKEVRKLIRQMQSANVGWGALRILGELLKLDIAISQVTVLKYMVRQQEPPSQTGRTFLENHADCVAGIDFFTVPTATFQILYVWLDAFAQMLKSSEPYGYVDVENNLVKAHVETR